MADDVLELRDDGSFDAGGTATGGTSVAVPSMSEVEALKAAGNALLKAGELPAAQRRYSEAVEAWRKMETATGGGDTALLAQCLANRSFVLLQMDEPAEALQLAQAAVEAAPRYAKAHHRVGKALCALGRADESARALQRARALNAPKSGPGECRPRCKPKAKHTLTGSSKDPAKPKSSGAFLAQQAGLYADKDDVVDMSKLSEEERTLLRSMCSSVLDSTSASSCSQTNIDGLFKQMLDPLQFRKAVYPGVSEVERSSAPQSFQALLRSDGYREELTQLMPRVKAKAHSVLDNVKRKGAAAGDVMDAATEAFLWPQVLREAFAHEVVKMVKRVSSRQHLRHANDSSALASPHADQAMWDQLPESVVPDLAQNGFAQLDDFLGEDWPPLVLADARRFASSGRMARATEVDGLFAWIETEQCAAEIAAHIRPWRRGRCP